jgi:hypothetical protein
VWERGGGLEGTNTGGLQRRILQLASSNPRTNVQRLDSQEDLIRVTQLIEFLL